MNEEKKEVTLMNFLRKHGILEEFKTNFINYGFSWTLEEYSERYSKDINAIKGAFLWFNTPEGIKYWEKIHELWLKELETIKK